MRGGIGRLENAMCQRASMSCLELSSCSIPFPLGKMTNGGFNTAVPGLSVIEEVVREDEERRRE